MNLHVIEQTQSGRQYRRKFDFHTGEDTRVAGLLYEAAGIKRKAVFVRHDAATAAATAPRV